MHMCRSPGCQGVWSSPQHPPDAAGATSESEVMSFIKWEDIVGRNKSMVKMEWSLANSQAFRTSLTSSSSSSLKWLILCSGYKSGKKPAVPITITSLFLETSVWMWMGDINLECSFCLKSDENKRQSKLKTRLRRLMIASCGQDKSLSR